MDVMGMGVLGVDVIDLKMDFFLVMIIEARISIKNGKNIVRNALFFKGQLKRRDKLTSSTRF